MMSACGGFESFLACWVVVLASLAAATDEVDCRNVSGYASGTVPDTCTVKLTLNETETEIISSLSSLRAECKDFPLKCRLRKYIMCIVITDSVNLKYGKDNGIFILVQYAHFAQYRVAQIKRRYFTFSTVTNNCII